MSGLALLDRHRDHRPVDLPANPIPPSGPRPARGRGRDRGASSSRPERPTDGKTAWAEQRARARPDAGDLVASWTPPDEEELNSGDVDLARPPALVRGPTDGSTASRRRTRSCASSTSAGWRMVQALPTPGARSMFARRPCSADRVHRHGRGHRRLPPDGERRAAAPQRVAERRGRDEPGDRRRPGLCLRPHERRDQHHRPDSADPVATLAAEAGHWQSPIAIDGCVLVGEGDANEHVTSGTLSVSCLP